MSNVTSKLFNNFNMINYLKIIKNISIFRNYNISNFIKSCFSVFGLSDVPGITLVKSNTAILLIKADQSLKFSLSVYTYESLNNKS